MDQITDLLRRHGAGDERALESLLPIVYAELRGLARRQLAKQPSNHTLTPTELVHEVFLKLVGEKNLHCRDSKHFFAVAARGMRWILVDHARRRLAKKRDTKRAVLAVSVYGSGQTLSADEVLAISAALERLFRKHPRQGEVVELFIFGGLNHAEIAGVLDVSIPTVERDWRFARAWLSRELRPA